MALQESVKKEVELEGAKGELDPSGNDIAPIYNLESFNIYLFRLFSSSLLKIFSLIVEIVEEVAEQYIGEDHETEAKRN